MRPGRHALIDVLAHLLAGGLVTDAGDDVLAAAGERPRREEGHEVGEARGRRHHVHGYLGALRPELVEVLEDLGHLGGDEEVGDGPVRDLVVLHQPLQDLQGRLVDRSQPGKRLIVHSIPSQSNLLTKVPQGQKRAVAGRTQWTRGMLRGFIGR